MGRQLRTDHPGAWHHVMNRGAGRRDIFGDDEDRWLFLALVGEASERHDVEVHAFCLMPNHFHLLVRSQRGELSPAMQHVAGCYTRRHGHRHGRDGPLFRGRFRSVAISDEAHIVRASVYIHRNPADLGADVANFRWSSAPVYLGDARRPAWLHRSTVLGLVGSIEAYRDLVVSDTTVSDTTWTVRA